MRVYNAAGKEKDEVQELQLFYQEGGKGTEAHRKKAGEKTCRGSGKGRYSAAYHRQGMRKMHERQRVLLAAANEKR